MGLLESDFYMLDKKVKLRYYLYTGNDNDNGNDNGNSVERNI